MACLVASVLACAGVFGRTSSDEREPTAALFLPSGTRAAYLSPAKKNPPSADDVGRWLDHHRTP